MTKKERGKLLLFTNNAGVQRLTAASWRFAVSSGFCVKRTSWCFTVLSEFCWKGISKCSTVSAGEENQMILCNVKWVQLQENQLMLQFQVDSV